MTFLFSKTVRDIVRSRSLFQSIEDQLQQKKRGDTAPPELPNLALHGMTPNGTYFFCNLVYQKDLTERKKITIFHLIDAYAHAEEHAERVSLKSQIKEACGEQVEGIALLFSNASETYGFVTGNRVKVARWRDTGPLELDADELFSDSHQLGFNFCYFVFILENERAYTPELIRQYVQGDEQNDSINTDVINAIKCINTLEKRLEDMSRYLKTAYTAIQNAALQQHVKAVYDALQLLSDYDDKEIKFKATALTLQLLHSQDNEKRKQLLADYSELASELYGSKIPTLMIVGISLFLLGASFLVISVLTSPVIIPSYFILMASGSSLTLLIGLICGIEGQEEFYSGEAKQKRCIANTFFNLKDNLNTIPEDLIPRKMSDLSTTPGERASYTP